MKNILVLDGPNLDMIGVREPGIYGTLSRREIIEKLGKVLPEKQFSITFFQSDWEKELIGKVKEASAVMDGLVINPGALTHFHYGLRDALASCTVPKIEVHMSHIYNREEWRKVSVTAPVCDGMISGLGWRSYELALRYLATLLEKDS